MLIHRLGTVLAGLALLAPLAAPPAHADHADPPGPVHAGSSYGWYPAAARWEFIGPLGREWRRRGEGQVHNVNGMLTLISTRRGTLSAELKGHAHATGRWEIRAKSRDWARGGAVYSVKAELVPARGKEHCGARNVGFASHRVDAREVDLYARNLPDLTFRRSVPLDVRGDSWHTFAVEVTKRRVSWFVDAHVVATETRPEAISGEPLNLRLSLEADEGTRMDKARLQLDWARYWTLRKGNRLPVDAPQPEKETYARAC